MLPTVLEYLTANWIAVIALLLAFPSAVTDVYQLVRK